MAQKKCYLERSLSLPAAQTPLKECVHRLGQQGRQLGELTAEDKQRKCILLFE